MKEPEKCPPDWAKTKDGVPGISVRQHLYTVFCVARALTRRLTLPPDCPLTREGMAFLAGAHDVGKHSLDFLQLSKVWLERHDLLNLARNCAWKDKYERSHSKISQDSFLFFLQSLGVLDESFIWATVVGAHHGKVLSEPSSEISEDDLSPFENERQELLEELWNYAGQPELPGVDEDAQILWFVGGLITLADWIGSDETFFPAAPPTGAEPSVEALSVAAEQAVETLGLFTSPLVGGLSFQELFGGKEPYPLQRLAAERIDKPGVYVIEAPMGMGKTEAALFVAYGLLERGLASGIYFALPTQATSNRIFLRFKAFIDAIAPNALPVQLIHGHSWLQDELKALASPAHESSEKKQENEDYSWFSSAKRALFAPFGVGTVDQALLAGVAVKHVALRRFALAGKVIILDEIHSYDVYTGTLIQLLCQKLESLGCTILILSATLTSGLRASLLGTPADIESATEPYPYITGRVGSVELEPVTPPSVPDKTVTVLHKTRDETLLDCLRLAEQGGLVLWICNTVAQAQETYAALKARRSENAPELGLLHARFPFFRRDMLENHWMECFGKHGRRDRGAILVSTQIVEQSVDLDADVLVSELAPTDMLLQRLGRLWRHPREARVVPAPTFYLLPEEAPVTTLQALSAPEVLRVLGSKARVYEPYALLRTLEQWESLERLAVPSEIRALMAATYAEREEVSAAWLNFEEKLYGKALAQKRQACMSANIWSLSLDDNMPVSTRMSGRNEYSFVFCREKETSHAELLEPGVGISLEKINGSYPFSLEKAKKMHRNVIRIPSFRFTSRPNEASLSAYHLDGYAVLRDGEVCVPNLLPRYRLAYSDELGLVVHQRGKHESC